MKHLKDFVIVNGQEYFVSTTFTMDRGLETMVFKSKDGKVIDWMEEFARYYDTVDESMKGHEDIVKHLRLYLACN